MGGHQICLSALRALSARCVYSQLAMAHLHFLMGDPLWGGALLRGGQVGMSRGRSGPIWVFIPLLKRLVPVPLSVPVPDLTLLPKSEF